MGFGGTQEGRVLCALPFFLLFVDCYIGQPYSLKKRFNWRAHNDKIALSVCASKASCWMNKILPKAFVGERAVT